MGYREKPSHRRISEAAKAARRLSGEKLEAVRRRVGAAINTKAEQQIRREKRKTGDELGDELQRFARDGRIASTVLSKFDPLGKAIEFVLGGLRQPGVSDQAVRDAIDLLRRVAPQALAPEFRSAPGQPPAKLRPIPVTRGRTDVPPAADPLPEPPPERLSDRQTAPAGRFVRDIPIDMIPVSGSSNVYAYGYDPVRHVLRVQFLASAVNGASLSKTKGGQWRGTLGSTVTNQRHGPGPTYDYFDVPPSVFQRMVSAASKGKAVWDLLRVRGTIEGHQYRYTLAAAGQANIVGADGGVTGQLTYVPRQAVRGGFQARRTGYGVRSVLPTEHRPTRFGPNDGSRGVRGNR